MKSRFPTFSSMADLASALDVPKSVLQDIKKDGCPAFDSNNRVSTEKLARWLLVRAATEAGENWSERLKKAQAMKAEHELKVTQGAYVERALVRSDMTKAASKAVAVLTQKFETELPPKQDGLPAEQIAAMNHKALHEVRTILSQPGCFE